MDHGREDKNPWSKWYWSDWMADAGIRASSLAAKGLWMEMLAIMAKSKSKGFLLDGPNCEKQMESKTLAKITGESVEVIEALLAELESHGVFSKDNNGVIFNRRMVREKSLSEIRSEAGRRGGRPKKQNQKDQKQTKAPSAYASASASASSESSDPILAEFEAGFWSAYPVRLGKQDALKAYRAVRKVAAESEILAGYNGYMDHLKDERINRNFEKSPMHPATFLRSERWREFVGFQYKPRL